MFSGIIAFLLLVAIAILLYTLINNSKTVCLKADDGTCSCFASSDSSDKQKECDQCCGCSGGKLMKKNDMEFLANYKCSSSTEGFKEDVNKESLINSKFRTELDKRFPDIEANVNKYNIMTEFTSQPSIHPTLSKSDSVYSDISNMDTSRRFVGIDGIQNSSSIAPGANQNFALNNMYLSNYTPLDTLGVDIPEGVIINATGSNDVYNQLKEINKSEEGYVDLPNKNIGATKSLAYGSSLYKTAPYSTADVETVPREIIAPYSLSFIQGETGLLTDEGMLIDCDDPKTCAEKILKGASKGSLNVKEGFVDRPGNNHRRL